jgi:hypothetical protein
MRRAHATRREQLAELPGAAGWFDLEDVATAQSVALAAI